MREHRAPQARCRRTPTTERVGARTTERVGARARVSRLRRAGMGGSALRAGVRQARFGAVASVVLAVGLLAISAAAAYTLTVGDAGLAFGLVVLPAAASVGVAVGGWVRGEDA